jgi:hypothetical protein
MTDPLRPFADVIRTLWRAKTARTRNAASGTNSTSTAETAEAAQTVSAGSNEALQSRLKARIATLDLANPRKLRETFVETVLLAELGERLAPDPAFAELVLRVSEQLDSDRQTGERLHQLLLDIAKG